MSTIMDAQIAADMALAAMDNRASWDALDDGQKDIAYVHTGAPLLLAARATYQAGHPVWMEED